MIFKRFSLLCYIFLALPLFGGDIKHKTSITVDAAYSTDDNKGYGQEGGFVPFNYTPKEAPGVYPLADGDGTRKLGSGWGGAAAKVNIKHGITFPMLQGTNSLTKDNNLQLNMSFHVAPVALYGEVSAILTPIAFLNFEFGGLLGSGWNAVLFNGLGLNKKGTPLKTSFPGVVTELWSAATLQFDLAALVPGEWNHVVALANFKFLYRHFSAATKGEAWQWLADDGENFNGFQFKGTYLLGYQMPLVLDTVGFLVETKQNMGDVASMSTMASGGWGSDFVEVLFGPLASFKFNDHHSLAVLFQFQTGRDYTDSTIFSNFYGDRKNEGTFVKFYRVALSYTFTF